MENNNNGEIKKEIDNGAGKPFRSQRDNKNNKYKLLLVRKN